MNTTSRCNLAERVRDALMTKISQGDIPPGERLVELALAKEYGTSQAPIREALRMLEAAGLVESIPHRGTRVRRFTDRELFESHTTRGYLEQGAALYIAKMFKEQPDIIQSLRDATQAMLAGIQAFDFELIARENYRFHEAIVKATGNRTLFQAWKQLDIESRGMMSVSRLRIDQVKFTEQHWPIIAALEQGDGEAAGKLLLEHALYPLHCNKQCPTDWVKVPDPST